MNKNTKIILLICAAVVILAVGLAGGYGISQINNSKTTTSTTTTQKDTSITLEQAREIAYKDAGVENELEVQSDSVYPDYEDGLKVFEVDFIYLGNKYEYEIVAENGEIHSKKAKDIRSQTSKFIDTTKQEEISGKYIGIDKAKLTSLNHAGFAERSDIFFKKAKLERDDGKMVYEIEFVVNGIEYEYEIDAVNGKVVSFDSEIDHD